MPIRQSPVLILLSICPSAERAGSLLFRLPLIVLQLQGFEDPALHLQHVSLVPSLLTPVTTGPRWLI